MIPEEKSVAVARALGEAFGATEFEDIRRMSNWLPWNLVFRIVVRGCPYILRIVTKTYDVPTRQYTCMKAAAEAGLAPRVWYINMEDQVSIIDFVNAAPFAVEDALVQIPATLRRLHALPPFVRGVNHLNTTCTFLLNKEPAVDGFLTRFRAANFLPKDESEELLARYGQVAAIYPRDEADMVSSHNDLKPENIIFDGQRMWLVDWEAAFLNDRYNDLAVIANFVATNETEVREYLQTYFGHAPDEYQLARFYVTRQLVHMFYAMGYLLLGSSGERVDHREKTPEFEDFHRRLWAGEVDLGDKRMKTIYGRVHGERLLRNVGQARFDEALRIVADGRAGSLLG